MTTGYFGMNILAFGEGSPLQRLLHGVVATAFFVGMVLFAIARSKRLSDFLEVMSDDRMPFTGKLRAFWRVVTNRPG